MYGLLQQLFLSFIGIFALIICVPCSAFTSQAKVVRWKLSTDFSSRRLSRTDVRKNFEGRRMSSSIFSSDDDQFPLGSRSDDNWTQSLDQIVEVDDPLASTLGVNLESDRATIDHDTSSTASLYKDIYSVALPALAACIVEPALSLVDTYYVGKAVTTGTLGLAGMSINSALFNVIAAATAPLGTGTTGVISKVRGLDEQKQNQVVRKYENQMDRDETFNNDNKRNNHNEFKSVTSDSVPIMLKEKESNVGTVFLNGIFLASFAGTLLSTIILIFGKQFIRQVFQIKDEFLITTVEYLKIRGLSLPAVLLNYIVFGFSIAMQDVMAPILSIITAFLVNVFGDFVLVGKLGYGLSGAAAATTISSYLGSFVALKHIIKRYNIKLPHTRENTALARDDNVTNGRKIEVKNDNNDNINKNKKIAWDQIVSKKGLNMFFSASGPLLIGALVNTLTYSAGARIASFTKSPTQATLEIAAHQIVMQSWWFLSYFSSPFSLVAQAVIPKDIIKNDNKRVRKMITLLLQLTSIVGILVTLCNILMIKSFPGIFTQNLTIQKIFQNVLIPSSLSLFIICLSTVSDGIFIGCNFISDYLKASYLSTLAAWIYYSYSIKNKLGIIGAWNGLLIFSVVRMSFYLIVYPKLWSSFSKRETDSGSSSDSQI